MAVFFQLYFSEVKPVPKLLWLEIAGGPNYPQTRYLWEDPQPVDNSGDNL